MKITREVINSKHGSGDMIATEIKSRKPWLNWYRFPLAPQFNYRSGNEQNTWGFGFHWLCFNVWTMDNPEIGFQVSLDDAQLQIRLRLPYLITGIFLPIFPQSFAFKLWRKPKREKYND